MYELLLLKEVGSAKLRESDIHPISPKTPAPQYQRIDMKKRKRKIVEGYSRDREAQVNKNKLALLLKPASRTPSTRGQQDHSRGTLRREQKSCETARFCSEVAHRYTDMQPGHCVLPAMSHTVQVAHH